MIKGYTYEKNKQKNGELEIAVKVNKERFSIEKAEVFKKLSKEVNLPGFRPGKGPEGLMEAKLGTRLYEETLNKLIPAITIEIMQEEKLNPITQVRYQLKKVADSEGMEFTATFVEMPKFNLADVKSIKIKEEDSTVTDKEVEESLNKLMELRKQDQQSETKNDKKKEKKPVINDEEVKKLGLGFDTVAKLKEQLKKNLEQEKKRNNEAKRMQKLVDELIKKSKVSVPQVLIDDELRRKMHDYEHKVKDLGLEMADFLKSQNKTETDLKNEWIADIKNRIATEMVLVKVATERNIKISPEDIEREINSIRDPKMKAEYETERGRNYISSILIQQRALDVLAVEAGFKT